MENTNVPNPPSLNTGLSQLEEGIALAQEGNHPAARAVFRRIIHGEPDCEDAWLWLAWVAESREQSLRYLQEAHFLIPDSSRIVDAMRWARRELGMEEEAQPAGAGTRAGRLAAQRTPKATLHAKPSTPRVLENATSPAPRKSSVEEPPRKPGMAPQTGAKALAGAGQVAQSAAQAAHAAGERAGRAASKVIASVPKVSLPASVPKLNLSAVPAPRKQVLVPLLSALAIVAIAVFAVLGLSAANRRMQAGAVAALALPTAVPHPTSTLSVEQRTEVWWNKADLAFTKADWTAAITALTQIRELDPNNPDVCSRLAEAHHQRGLTYVAANKLDEAQAEYDTAIKLDATNSALQVARSQLARYRSGVDAYWVQDWEQVVTNLRKLQKDSPDFRDARPMLVQGYIGLGQIQLEEDLLDESKTSFEAALELAPDSAEAQAGLSAVNNAITPPRRVEVSLSEFTATVYDDNVPVKVFSICWGRPSAPTVAGRYAIQSKMPMAYASKWDLDMPWWLGIYDAGGSENGFHALPYLSNGTVLWRGSLGTRCSFGCIVLDTADAKWLYDWAVLGDRVFVFD
ncbi:MAG: L,D-transpeptidase family protein [Anaerolineae bacterium]